MDQTHNDDEGQKTDDQPLDVEELELLLAQAVRAGSIPAMRLAHRIHRQREERDDVDELDQRRKRAARAPERIERLERVVRQLLRRVEELEQHLDAAQGDAAEALELAERTDASPGRR